MSRETLDTLPPPVPKPQWPPVVGKRYRGKRGRVREVMDVTILERRSWCLVAWWDEEHGRGGQCNGETWQEWVEEEVDG